MRAVRLHLEFVQTEDEGPLSDKTNYLLGEMVKEFEECLNLVLDKSQDYGDAWREQGWMGNVARVLSKAARLKNLTWREYEAVANVTNESITDSLRDMVNLAVFALYNRRLGNRWGQ